MKNKICLKFQIALLEVVRIFLDFVLGRVRVLIGKYLRQIKQIEFEKQKEFYLSQKGNTKFVGLNEQPSDRVVYTVLTGEYDALIPQYYYNPKWHYICFTDNRKLIENGHPFWKIVPFDSEEENIAKKSRIPKILAHKFLPDYKYSLYIDANVDIISSRIYDACENLIKRNSKMAGSIHDCRKCIYQEMTECMILEKDDAENIARLFKKYKAENFPQEYGLFENNVIFREHNDNDVKKLMDEWWYMVKTYSKRDQLSLMYVCWRQGFKIEKLLPLPLRLCNEDILFLEHKEN